MAGDLKNPDKGGEPDIEIIPIQDNGTQARQIQVKVNGVDVFHPNTGGIRSDGPPASPAGFFDTDYNEESFFVRHAYFLGASDPTRRSRPRSRPRSTAKREKRCTATPPAPSTALPPAGSPSTTSAMK